MTARLVLVLLLLLRARGAALMAPELCYILDAILFLYGVVLTVLYCQLKVSGRAHPHGPDPESIQRGLQSSQGGEELFSKGFWGCWGTLG
ncbi:PREDICTED: high affinity immunoglobulin epsilon receptor subunit gamma [Tinamus guttatus]|uniref:high affinity immunoglobulin epsilon receptor subunit gamma n=1 Tax=Tinamus guttatus TaxID=94827 RepID=UPI00052ECC66|nr:PREDICTED: high affinity immunoglobulin epsilon receptor subunit gamma [Tinamus guttatus]